MINRDMAYKTVSIQRKISLSASTSTSLVEESSDRIGLIINAPTTTRFTLSLEDTIANADEGIVLYPTNEPLILTLAEHGQLVTLSWAAFSTAAQDIYLIETFLRN